MKYIRKMESWILAGTITWDCADPWVVERCRCFLKAAREPDHLHAVAMTVFMLSMILLYLASTVYHTFDVKREGEPSTEKV